MRSTLAKDILVIGYDPEWDQPIEQAFPLVGGNVLYVNEEPPAENSHIAQVIQQRRGKCLVGAEGSYRKFIQAIYSQLINSRPLSLEILNQVFLGPLNHILIQIQEIRDILNRQMTPQELAPSEVSQVPPMPQEPVPYLVYSNKAQEPTSYPTKSENEKRTRVFISYSHRDERHLQRLHTHLASYERNGLVDVWDDKKIAAGADWRKEISMALKTTKVGVLLVSADFLASKFIAENELPPLLAAAKAGGVKIYSVILSPCVFEDLPLQQFQSVNEPSKPLIRMNQYEKEDIWAQVTRLIKNA